MSSETWSETEIKKFICSNGDCHKSFGRRSRFLIHLRTHSGEKPFVCSENGCTKSYARYQHLKRHVEISHSKKKIVQENNEQLKCSLSDCEKEFVSECNLRRHIKTVHGKQFKFRCIVEGCRKKFAEDHQLKRHELQHQNSKSYVCTFGECNYSCKIAHQLRRHMKIHEGYLCKEVGCNVKLETWTQLRKHCMIHHPKKFQCTECNKTFKKKIQLKRHSFLHSSAQPLYTCDHEGCERVYLDLRNLKSHVKSYHDGHRLPCTHPGCNQTFVNKAKLNQHGKLHDPNKPPPKKMPKKGHRKKSVLHHLSKLIGQDYNSDGNNRSDEPITNKITDLNDSGIVLHDTLFCTNAGSFGTLDAYNRTTSAIDTFSEHVDKLNAPFLCERLSNSNTSPQNFNESINSVGSDNSNSQIPLSYSDKTIYPEESLLAKDILSSDVQADAVDIWLDSMAENIVNSTEQHLNSSGESE